MDKPRILIVEDELIIAIEIEKTLQDLGYEVVSIVDNGNEALKKVEQDTPDLILMDIRIKGKMDGIEVATQIHSQLEVPIIFLTAYADENKLERAKLALPYGYLLKPVQDRDLKVTIEIALYAAKANTERNQAQEDLKKSNEELMYLKNQLKEENIYLREEIKLSHNFDEIISNNKKFMEVLEKVEQVAASEITVLILGETGTGKELLARAVHNLSNRRDHPLVKVNCATLTPNLIESELFGHEKGAFTGAISARKGRFELADNGTIFLDEIGDLPMDLQAKLLRVLQEGEFVKLGGTKTIKVNVRVIAATNRDLAKMRSEKLFRDDLFFRLDVFPITSPPLRERKDDIPELVSHFVKKFNKKTGKNVDIIPHKVIKVLQTLQWPGNIRELENMIERAVVQSQGNLLELKGSAKNQVTSQHAKTLLTLDQLQKEHILYVLKQTDGQISGDAGAAKILGLKPTTLESRMKKLGITSRKNFTS